MLNAIGDYCDDFPEPENPFSGTSFYSSHTASSSSSSSYDTDSSTDTTTDEHRHERR